VGLTVAQSKRSYSKDADQITDLYLDLVQAKLKAGDLEAIVSLVSLADGIANLTEMVRNIDVVKAPK
jgi:hypothetical protein